MAEKSESKRNDSVEVIQPAAICQRTRRAPSSRPRPNVPLMTVPATPARCARAVPLDVRSPWRAACLCP